jgi:NAD(P)-dependent dehydrogenase (short-subunit alcohol dehydrogenase family)
MSAQVAALVTGGSGGIGAAVCRRLVADGYRVFFTYNSNSAVAEAVMASNVGVAGTRLDLGDLQAVEEAGAQLAAEVPGIRVMVHCAGELPKTTWQETSSEVFVRCFTVNCASAFVLARQLAPAMIRAKGGSVVLVSSVLANVGAQARSAYAASKAALLGLTRALAVELAPEVRVNAVLPGVIATHLVGSLMADAERLAATERRIPLGHLGSAEDCADAVAFLAGPKSKYVTGATLVLDGGILSRSPLPAADPLIS